MSETIDYQPSPEDQMAVEQPIEYQLLNGHRRSDGSWKTGKQLRMEYLQLSDDLISKMTNGIEVVDPETGEVQVEKPSIVVWLDKSARPVSWLVKDLWPKLAPDPKTGVTPEMPAFKYVNIDREQWVNTLDPEGIGVMDIDRVDDSIIRGLRSIFVSPKQKEQGITEEIDAAPSILDNQTIMIVDEVYSSGRTLDYAQAFFQKAFPTAKVGSAYWMKGVTYRGEAKGNADLPVWYKKGTDAGRGVGNRDEAYSTGSNSITQRLGSYFLSTPFQGKDPLAKRLRVELRELATNPDVPVLPGISRADQEDRDARYEFYNDGHNKEEVLAVKKQIRAER